MAKINSPTITSVLQTIFDDVGEPLLVRAIEAGIAVIPGMGPPLAAAFTWLMKAPVIGSLLQGWLKSTVDALIANGVIEVKEGIIKYLDDKARAKWAPEVSLIQQYNQEGKTMSPEEQAAFDAALQNLVRNRSGTVLS